MVFDIDVDVAAADMYRDFTTISYWEDLVVFYREHMGSRTEIAHFSTDADGTDVSFSHILSAKDFPAIVGKVVPGTFVVTREQHFEPFDAGANQVTGRYRALVPAPVEVTGDYLLHDTDRGSRMRLQSTCRARVPLLGGQIEQLMVSGLKVLFTEEGKFTAEWLNRH